MVVGVYFFYNNAHLLLYALDISSHARMRNNKLQQMCIDFISFSSYGPALISLARHAITHLLLTQKSKMHGILHGATEPHFMRVGKI